MSNEQEFGLTIHGIGSALDHLKKLAAEKPAQARRHAEWLGRVADELSELAAKLQMRDAAE